MGKENFDKLCGSSKGIIYFLGTGDIFKLFSGNKGTLE